MPTIKDQLRADLTSAMKARDQTRTRTLRMALTSISNEEVSGAVAHDLTDDEVLKILAREAKRRREAAAAFAEAGREDQAAAERAEEEVLAGYLPAQLSDDDLAALVTAADRRDGRVGTGCPGSGHEDPDAQGGGPGRREPGRRRGAGEAVWLVLLRRRPAVAAASAVLLLGGPIARRSEVPLPCLKY